MKILFVYPQPQKRSIFLSTKIYERFEKNNFEDDYD